MRLGYVILYVQDVPGTVAFYEQAFGVTRRFVHESGRYAELETGGTALAFASEEAGAETCSDFRRNRHSDQAAGAEVAFVTDDVEGRFQAAVAHGATPLVGPMQKPWGQIVSYVRDNNGFLVEICSEVSG